MKEKRCSDDDVCVDTVCMCVWGLSPPSLSLCAPSFLLLLSGQEVARGYNILSGPIIVTVEEERDKWEMGRQKKTGWKRDESRQEGRREERRMGHCADKVHHYTIFQETDQDWLELSMNLNYLKPSCVCSQSLLIKWKECRKVPFNWSGHIAQWL